MMWGKGKRKKLWRMDMEKRKQERRKEKFVGDKNGIANWIFTGNRRKSLRRIKRFA